MLQLKYYKLLVECRDVFVCVPTGFGKSFCYSFLPDIFYFLYDDGCSISDELYVSGSIFENPYIIFVITPLLSLMEDQTKRFLDLGLSCSFVGENQKDNEELSAKN